jgi:hypothetical protein
MKANMLAAGELSLGIVIDTMKRWLDGEPVWPYAKILEVWGPDFEMYRLNMFTARGLENMKQAMGRIVLMSELRNQWIEQFGFAIPCAELLDELAKAEHVVEVGAGTGYMTRLMRNRGIEVIGSDSGDNFYKFKLGAFDDRQVRAQGKTMVRRHRDSTVFCSWPSLKETWFRQMLKAMQIGQRLAVIREDACAEDSAWDYLDACFEEEKLITIPAFMHMNDYASVHVKKRQRATKEK